MKFSISIQILFLLLIISSPLTAANGIITGTGTLDSPFLIHDVEDFLEFSSQENAGVFWAAGTYARLTNPLDFSEYPISPRAYIAPDTDNTNWEAFDGTPYEGTFDGNGCTISNTTIGALSVSCCYLGIFGKIGSSGSVSNLHLQNVTIYGAYDSRIVGPICGCNAGAVSNCSIRSVTINTSSNYNTVYGGFCGCNTGSITNSFVEGVEKPQARCAHSFGGFCGRNSGSIQQCYARVSYFYCDDLTGGFCGFSNGNIQNCYSICDKISGSVRVGCFGGKLDAGFVSNCYAIVGSLTAQAYYGGLWGTAYIPCTDSFYCNPDYSGGADYLSFEQMTHQSNFTNWDFDDVWKIREGFDSPALRFQETIPGDIAGDYGVNMIDFGAFSAAWQTNKGGIGWNSLCDLDTEGKSENFIDMKDLNVFAQHWLIKR